MALKLGKVADKHLEVMLEQLETKRTNIPFADLAASTNTVLERLGFGPGEAGPANGGECAAECDCPGERGGACGGAGAPARGRSPADPRRIVS